MKKMENVALLTICSLNYLARAEVLIESYGEHHPDHDIYIVLVDRKLKDHQLVVAGAIIIWVEDLGIPDFLQHALEFDIIELNTNVKPAALIRLSKKYEQVVYLDPDIFVVARLDSVFDALKVAPVVVTPHMTHPLSDGQKPDDRDLLRFGAFNLGFIAIRRSESAMSFLNWWSERCLADGFYEPESGFAVDQKWVDLAPCFVPQLHVSRDLGLNVAFWNLHERSISSRRGKWMVNGDVTLRFVHFSSFDPLTPERVANKQTRYSPGSRPDFTEIATVYAARLLKKTHQSIFKDYGYDFYGETRRITPAFRRLYAGLKRAGCFRKIENPFSHPEILRMARRYRLTLPSTVTIPRAGFRDVAGFRKQIKLLMIGFRFLLLAIGPIRYFNLMRFLAHISSLRNQSPMLLGRYTQRSKSS